jgi:hypothetical protein
MASGGQTWAGKKIRQAASLREDALAQSRKQDKKYRICAS